MDVVAHTDGAMPEQVEELVVAGVVDARDHALDAVALARDLADDDVVLVVPRHGHDELGALDAAALQHGKLGRVAVLRDVLELLLQQPVAGGRLLDHGHLVPHLDQLVREVATDLAAARDEDVHQIAAVCESTVSESTSIAPEVGHTVRMPSSA